MAEIKVAMISSTLQDLPEHRQKVRDACLRQRVMPSMLEHWPALDIDGVAASLKSVDDADIYVGVFAHRYGYVPEGENRSITEMEYERAVQRGIPRLIFIIDQEHALKISQIEVEAAEKLQNLKNRLKHERTVAFFRSADDLGLKVLHSLSEYSSAKACEEPIPGALASATVPVFDPRNYAFFVPFRAKGDQVVGRDAAIKAVRNQLVNGHRTAIGQTASFQGLGGLGKTQLAVEYAYLFRDQYPNGVIWLNADQEIEAQLIKIAEKARWVAPEAIHKDKLAIAQQRLRTHSHCLIIFDNLESSDVVGAYLPEPEAEPHLLVTSRIDQPDFVPVPLELLDVDLSLRLLTQEAGRSPANEEESKAAREISERLGGLPLALELAGAYLRHRPIDWIRYRDLLNQNLKAALPSQFLRGSFTRHEADLYSTLKVNDDVLSEEPVLREILDILTCSGPSAIGQSLLCAVLGVGDPSEAAGAISLGIALRLIRKTPGTESYALHRLVCEVRREDISLSDRRSWAVTIAERVGDWFQALKRDFSDLPCFEAEIEHLRAWQENIQEFAPKLASRLNWLQAYPPFHRGQYEDSHGWLEKARTLLSLAGDDDPELKANLLTDLCTINNQLGKYAAARACGEEALALRIRVLGEHNAETAMSYHNLGATLRVLGDAETALDYSQKALAIWRDIHGDDHIDTAMALDASGACLSTLGRKKEALEYGEHALAVRKKVLGDRHPDTATSHNNLGSLFSTLGDHSGALESEEKALGIANELFGARSPLKAKILKNMAFAHHGLKDFKKALAAGLESLEICKSLFGDQHPETLMAAVEVGVIYCAMGRVHQGFQIVDDYLKIIPKDHSHHEWLKSQSRSLHSQYFVPGFRQRSTKRR